MAAKSVSKSLVWILLGLLILGLGGFGVTNLSGNLRTIGSVGDVSLDVDEYARALQREISALEAQRGEPVSFASAREAGVTEAVLARLIATAAFDHEAATIGVSVGDAAVRDEIVAMSQFRGPDGEFDREAYRFALEQAGLSEGRFEADIRANTARSFLQAAVMAGVTMPDGYMRTLLDYLGERREVAWAVLERGDLVTGLPEPTQADLAAWHEANAARFTLPERKRIVYAWLSPDMVVDDVEIDEQALRDLYQAHRDQYILPERRLVERLGFADTAAAEAARARIDSNDASFDDLVAERGLDLGDVDLGDVTLADLGEAGEAVFAAGVGDVAGPLPSAIGPALFRVNARLAAQETSLDDARDELRKELVADRARRIIEGRIDGIDDLLAAGATVEDLAGEDGMELGRIDWHEGLSEGIAAYDAFRTAAAALNKDDFPEVTQLGDGAIVVMRLDEVVPPALQPLDEVREAVAAAWSADRLVQELKKQAQPLVSKLESETTFAQAGLVEDGRETLTRRDFRADLPPDLIKTVFTMEPGSVALIEGAARLFVVRLEGISPPDPDDGDLAQLQAVLRQQAATGLAQDLFQVLADDIRLRAGIEIDQAALNAVHASFQ